MSNINIKVFADDKEISSISSEGELHENLSKIHGQENSNKELLKLLLNETEHSIRKILNYPRKYYKIPSDNLLGYTIGYE